MVVLKPEYYTSMVLDKKVDGIELILNLCYKMCFLKEFQLFYLCNHLTSLPV